MDKVTIQIIAGPNRGKTTIAAIIKEALQERGFTDVKVFDIPPSSNDKEPIAKRVAAAQARPVEIQVVHDGLCERCRKNPVAYDGARFCGAACSQRYESGDR